MRYSKRNKSKMRARRAVSNRAAVSARIAPTDEELSLKQDQASAAFTRDANSTNSRRKTKRAGISRISIPIVSVSTDTDAPTIDNPLGLVTSYVTDGNPFRTFQR